MSVVILLKLIQEKFALVSLISKRMGSIDDRHKAITI